MKKALKDVGRAKLAAKPNDVRARAKDYVPKCVSHKAGAECISSKSDRQAAFLKEVRIHHLSPDEAADRARLIPAADVKAFRIIRMPG